MKKVFFVLVAVLFFPTITFGASFARESLFLSKSSVVEGETVIIHTIVSNEAAAKFSGTLTLANGDVKIGTVPVTLLEEEAHAVSISWKPTAGTHTIEATLTGTDGKVVEETSATFRIQEKPKEGVGATTSEVQSSADIQNQLASISPGAAEAAAPVFSTIDSVRGSIAGAIDKGIAWAESQAVPKKQSAMVLGAQDGDEESKGIMGTLWTILTTLLLHVFSILKFLISNAGIFYPLFAVLFLYSLWRLYKRMRRPKYPEF